MLRIGLYLLCFSLASMPASRAFAEASDPYFDQDLQAANADARYAHLSRATEKVRVYRLHHYAPGDWDKLDPNFDGMIDAATAAKLRQPGAPSPRVKPTKSATAAPGEKPAAVPSGSTVPDGQSLVKAKPMPPDAWGTSPGRFVFYLRKDFTDLVSLSQPNYPADSVGATLSYTSNKITNNNVWAGQAAVFSGYSYLAPNFGAPGQPYLLDLTAGPYYTVNKTFNSNSAQASQNTDVETFGGAAEVGGGNVLGIDQFFAFSQFRLGGTQDNVKDTSSVSGVADFIPVYAPLLIHQPHQIGSFRFRIDPSFLVQYDSVAGKNQLLLFSGRPQSLRIGPQISLWMVPFEGITDLEKLNATVTYHWENEAYSRAYLHWLEADLTYKLSANFGVTASYQNGSNENTGASTNVYTVSLTSALDYCLPACPTAPSSGSSGGQ